MEQTEIKFFVEAAILAAGRPLSIDQLKALFDGRSAPDKSEIRKAIAELVEEYEPRGFTIGEVASGFRIQIKPSMADRLHKLWEERPPRYSRALFETLALVAYRQPITRGEIEEIRGVSVSSNIIRTLMERDWVRVVGHRDVPGRPAMFGTTRTFLDYFGLKKLDDLPPLADLADWESLRIQLNLPEVEDSGEVAVSGEADIEASNDADQAETADSEAEADAVEDGQDEVADSEVETDVVETLPDDADETSAESPEEPSDSAGAEDESTGDELVVSQWPDPADARAIATLRTNKDDKDDDDRDASAGGG
ncbi:MAG: SMC-Scp complex subunit ScpB [Pseudomonadota bacterium]